MAELVIGTVYSEEGGEAAKLEPAGQTGFPPSNDQPPTDPLSEYLSTSDARAKEPPTELSVVPDHSITSKKSVTSHEAPGVQPKRSSSRSTKGKKADTFSPDKLRDREMYQRKMYQRRRKLKQIFKDTGQDKTTRETTLEVPEFIQVEDITFLPSEVSNHKEDLTTVPKKSKFEHEESVLMEAKENLLKAVDSINLCETQLVSLQEVYADSVKQSALSQLQSVKETLGNVLHELNSNRQQKRIKLEMMYEQEIEDRWDTVEVKSEISESNEENGSSGLGLTGRPRKYKNEDEDFRQVVGDTSTQETPAGRPRRSCGKSRKYKDDMMEDFCEVLYDDMSTEAAVMTMSNQEGKKSLKRGESEDEDFQIKNEEKDQDYEIDDDDHDDDLNDDLDDYLDDDYDDDEAEKLEQRAKRKKYHHPPPEKLKCPHCDKEYGNYDRKKSRKRLTAHIQREHLNTFPCLQCDQVFQTKVELTNHKQSCSRTICPICGANVVASRLLWHMRYHDEKKHKCDECGKKYHNKITLEEHKRSHTGEKPFRCEECGKGFIGLRSLQRHRFIHTGEKPYKCDQCHMAFNQKYNLTVHKKSHIRGTIKADPTVLKNGDDNPVENGDTVE